MQGVHGMLAKPPLDPCIKEYHGQRTLTNELSTFRCKRAGFAISTRIAIISHPIIWPILKKNLISNSISLFVFIEKIISFLLSDNSVSPAQMNAFSLDQPFQEKIARSTFFMIKQVLIVVFKEYNMSHALLTRIIEAFTDLTNFFVGEEDWAPVMMSNKKNRNYSMK